MSPSVDISVLGLASAILDSPQFSVLPLDMDTRFNCCFFSGGNLCDSTWAADGLMFKEVVNCFHQERRQERFVETTHRESTIYQMDYGNFTLSEVPILRGSEETSWLLAFAELNTVSAIHITKSFKDAHK